MKIGFEQFTALLLCGTQWLSAQWIDIDSICVHDPQILADKATQTYYLYGQYSPNRDYYPVEPPAQHAGVLVYTSKDLKHWTIPKLVFEVPEGFWGDPQDAPWAPEVHLYNGKYYLFVTFNDWSKTMEERPERPPITQRASQILVSDSPMGPFKPFSNTFTTAKGDMTLDATFWEEDGIPYIVYCHEWIQVGAGLIEAAPLKSDLSALNGSPFKLICSNEVSWPKDTINYKGKMYDGIVTDGPYLYRMKSGKLAMLWSSWGNRQYAQTVAYSPSGKLSGPWVHEPKPIIEDDRGHGMVFTSFDGKLLLCLHRYFHQPATRVQIFEIKDTGKSLKVGKQLYGAR